MPNVVPLGPIFLPESPSHQQPHARSRANQPPMSGDSTGHGGAVIIGGEGAANGIEAAHNHVFQLWVGEIHGRIDDRNRDPSARGEMVRLGKVEFGERILGRIGFGSQSRALRLLLEAVGKIGLRGRDNSLLLQLADHVCGGTTVVNAPAIKRAAGQSECLRPEPGQVMASGDLFQSWGGNRGRNIEHELIGNKPRLAVGGRRKPGPEGGSTMVWRVRRPGVRTGWRCGTVIVSGRLGSAIPAGRGRSGAGCAPELASPPTTRQPARIAGLLAALRHRTAQLGFARSRDIGSAPTRT